MIERHHTHDDLMAQARVAAEASYSPYSRFRVGAVAVADDGSTFVGCNVENAAYGAAICAEANAISTAAATGVRKLSTIVVSCPDGGECYPCGNCRQLMREFGVEFVVVQYGVGGIRVHPFDAFLPHSFGPESLA